MKKAIFNIMEYKVASPDNTLAKVLKCVGFTIHCHLYFFTVALPSLLQQLNWAKFTLLDQQKSS